MDISRHPENFDERSEAKLFGISHLANPGICSMGDPESSSG